MRTKSKNLLLLFSIIIATLGLSGCMIQDEYGECRHLYDNTLDIDYNYTGMDYNDWGWWYFQNGHIDFNYTGMAYNEFGWWYFQNGHINFNYTGMAYNEFGWWYFQNGHINFNYTGMAYNEFGWWYFQNGHIDFNYTGMAYNEFGWWYFQNGHIDFNYTGLAYNEFGGFYFINGYLDFSYTGEYTDYYGNSYTIVNGHVEHMHLFDEGVITKEPTHFEEGTKTFTCKSCNKTYEYPIISVSKDETGRFSTINDALNYAISQPRSSNRQYIILIYPGIYHEKLVGNYDYINFEGIDNKSCIIEYESYYPDCVIYMHGFLTFSNLTIRATNNAYYCIHADLVQNRRAYKLNFRNCIITGAAEAVGYGATESSCLEISNCKLYASLYPIYVHNSPCSNSPGQQFILKDNLIDVGCDGVGICIDDAANKFGAINSYLFINATNNSSTVSSPKLLYRLIPGIDEYNINQLNEFFQIRLTNNSSNNAIYELNHK